jgi:uncharacterized protein YjbI with pentapeptide repeats
MANPEHLAILKQGVEVWNKWREENPGTKIDLRKTNFSETDLRWADLREAKISRADFRSADLRGARLNWTILIKAKFSNANLSGVDLRNADLRWAKIGEADLSGADLRETDLRGADLSGANIREADLSGADLRKADLRKANLKRVDLGWADLREANITEVDLSRSNLSEADIRDADLSEANLELATLVETKLQGTKISNARIYGISAWNLKTSKRTEQLNLVITRFGEPVITIDNLEIAQFVNLLLDNEKIRNVIDTIGKKGVLILGRFTEERKAVLDAIRNKLRELGFVPMMFDFEKPTQRDFTETIKTLAGMSRFIIADITNPKSSPLELQATMPDYMIPFVPIIQEDEKPFSMFQDLKNKYGEWVLDPLEYDTAQGLLDVFDEAVVAPANEMAGKLELKKAEQIRTRHVKDYKKG